MLVCARRRIIPGSEMKKDILGHLLPESLQPSALSAHPESVSLCVARFALIHDRNRVKVLLQH